MKLFYGMTIIILPIMRILITLFSLVILTETASAQNIDFTELIPGPGFLDARNGSVANGDIDGDGDIDVLLTGKDGNILHSSLYFNDGAGNFTLATGTPFIGLQFGDSEFADVDNDGDLDILITGFNNQPVYFASLFLNNGTGEFSLVSNTPFEPSVEGDIAFEDIDNDGDNDLMMVGIDYLGNGFTKLYQNNGSGQFIELTSSNFEPAKFGSIAFFDFDNDNDKDVIVSGENNNGTILTTLYSNNGSGEYTTVSNTPFSGVHQGDIGVTDTDNDGDIDVLLNGRLDGANNATNIYLNDGAGSFTVLTNTNFPQTFLSEAEFADFDEDGDMDVLITGAIGGAQFASHLYENTGLNNFIFADTLNPMYLTSTAIADFDGDTDLDVIMVGIQNSLTAFKTRTFINNLTFAGVLEPGYFPVLNIYPNPSRSIVTIDLNGDPVQRIEVFRLIGDLILKDETNSVSIKLNIGQFPSGTYIIKVYDKNDNFTTAKIIRE